MKTSRRIGLICAALVAGVFVGCEIVTQEPAGPGQVKPAHSVVINELFILPAPNQHPYRWVEFYNPTNQSVNISRWTLGFRTKETFIVYHVVDSVLQVKSFSQDSVARYHDVPLRFIGGTRIPSYGFVTIVSDQQLMENYTTAITLPDPIEVGQTIFFEDSVSVDSVVNALYEFNFQDSDQMVLKDTSGTVIDVIRYGNYVYTGSDPSLAFPNNQSLGPIVPYQSFARWAGAYTSGPNGDASQGSSAADFYVTGVQVANTRPIPQWLSQAFKP